MMASLASACLMLGASAGCGTTTRMGTSLVYVGALCLGAGAAQPLCSQWPQGSLLRMVPTFHKGLVQFCGPRAQVSCAFGIPDDRHKLWCCLSPSREAACPSSVDPCCCVLGGDARASLGPALSVCECQPAPTVCLPGGTPCSAPCVLRAAAALRCFSTATSFLFGRLRCSW